jgi:hypothetical protein
MNPGMINPELKSHERKLYLNLFYEFADVLALSLQDIQHPALIEPMKIKTFGQPVKRNPTRLAQMHRSFV